MFRYIRAMSLNKHLIERKLLDAVDPLTDHLIKLYAFPNTEYVNHWRQEVWGFLHTVPKLKSSNKLPSVSWIYSILSSYLDMLDSLMDVVLDEYKMLKPSRTNTDELEQLAASYLKWLSSELSSKGAVTATDVYAQLSKLDL